MSHIAQRWRNLTHNTALTFPGKLRQKKKYSSVTCRGEQCPSKFDKYSCQLKSMFACEPDLNTLPARQVNVWQQKVKLTPLSTFIPQVLVAAQLIIHSGNVAVHYHGYKVLYEPSCCVVIIKWYLLLSKNAIYIINNMTTKFCHIIDHICCVFRQ